MRDEAILQLKPLDQDGNEFIRRVGEGSTFVASDRDEIAIARWGKRQQLRVRYHPPGSTQRDPNI